MNKVKQEVQTVHIPATGETVKAKTYSGKELFWKGNEIEKDEEYAKLWEDDRI
ncbi:hypothetical protein ACQCN2_15980 [Brevibacillus ginsengisoli]|uniref:hypothetical protein n=1 Tax=Brevibacillus ginsengisoli TaxID=363854 RepID=UPI003CEE1BC7